MLQMYNVLPFCVIVTAVNACETQNNVTCVSEVGSVTCVVSASYVSL